MLLQLLNTGWKPEEKNADGIFERVSSDISEFSLFIAAAVRGILFPIEDIGRVWFSVSLKTREGELETFKIQYMFVSWRSTPWFVYKKDSIAAHQL